ncbi:hypothetical protein PIROE2DRAFT_18274 [Piromyces sp. E2]|nr:hypothetical protein PIROE2DRAFT_18274 [Piromyces sp. E2]|eukprot:OUM56910.1 hypothetical protein PIROE2DRAFT_18274 [Piromyces sp. E2]
MYIQFFFNLNLNYQKQKSLVFVNQSADVVQATKMLEKVPNCDTYLLMSHEGDVLVYTDNFINPNQIAEQIYEMLNDTQKLIESGNNGGFVKFCSKYNNTNKI